MICPSVNLSHPNRHCERSEAIHSASYARRVVGRITRPVADRRPQVTQRPGCSNFATSVKTLTDRLAGDRRLAMSPGFVTVGGAGRLRASSVPLVRARGSAPKYRRGHRGGAQSSGSASQRRNSGAIGLGGAVDAGLGRDRSDLLAAGQIMAERKLHGADTPRRWPVRRKLPSNP